jgi:hypothetical protein
VITLTESLSFIVLEHELATCFGKSGRVIASCDRLIVEGSTNMSGWKGLFGGGGNSDLPDNIQPREPGATGDSAFEVFIDSALTKIYNDAAGKSKEHRQIREQCKKLLGESCSLHHKSRCWPKGVLILAQVS